MEILRENFFVQMSDRVSSKSNLNYIGKLIKKLAITPGLAAAATVAVIAANDMFYVAQN
jgi:hypothetical protein